MKCTGGVHLRKEFEKGGFSGARREKASGELREFSKGSLRKGCSRGSSEDDTTAPLLPLQRVAVAESEERPLFGRGRAPNSFPRKAFRASRFSGKPSPCGEWGGIHLRGAGQLERTGLQRDPSLSEFKKTRW